MDKRIMRYLFKDIKFNSFCYFVSLIVFLVVGYILKYFNIITEISGLEIVGVLIISITNGFNILYDFLFLKGNNFKRKSIGIAYLVYGIILSGANSIIINLINYILKGTMIIESFINLNTIYIKFILAFVITFILLLCAWTFALFCYRTKGNKILDLVFIISIVVSAKIIQKPVVSILLNLNTNILGIIILSIVLTGIFYWRVMRFKVMGDSL